MSYIPKSAQRKIARAQQIRATLPDHVVKAELPRRLESGDPGAGMFDVYFNGERQHLCKTADVTQGFIERFVHGRGRTALTDQTEVLRGKVEILRKGQRYGEG